MATAEMLMTAEEFGRRPDPGHPEELVRGRIVAMPPPDRRHGKVCARTTGILDHFVVEHDLGHVMSNDSGVDHRARPRHRARGRRRLLQLRPIAQGPAQARLRPRGPRAGLRGPLGRRSLAEDPTEGRRVPGGRRAEGGRPRSGEAAGARLQRRRGGPGGARPGGRADASRACSRASGCRCIGSSIDRDGDVHRLRSRPVASPALIAFSLARPGRAVRRGMIRLMEPTSYDLIVIGSGPAGESAAAAAAAFGKRAAIVETQLDGRRGQRQHRHPAQQDPARVGPGDLRAQGARPLRRGPLAPPRGHRRRVHVPRAAGHRQRAQADRARALAARRGPVPRHRLVPRPAHHPRRDRGRAPRRRRARASPAATTITTTHHAAPQPRDPPARRDDPDRHRVVARPSRRVLLRPPPRARLRHDPPARAAAAVAGGRRRGGHRQPSTPAPSPRWGPTSGSSTAATSCCRSSTPTSRAPWRTRCTASSASSSCGRTGSPSAWRPTTATSRSSSTPAAGSASTRCSWPPGGRATPPR